MDFDYERRWKKLISKAEEKGVEVLVILSEANCFYLTGALEPSYPGRWSALIINVKDSGGGILIIPELEEYETLDKLKAKGLEIRVVERGKRALSYIEEELEKIRPKVIGVEESISKEYLEGITKKLFPQGSKPGSIREIGEILANLRAIKEPAEIEAIKEATRITIDALNEVKERLREGMREAEVASILVSEIIKLGAKIAFEPIVASGPRAAYPHGIYSRRKIRRGEIVVVDAGARVHGYCSDITRVFIIGDIPKEIAKYLATLEKALDNSLASLKGDIKASIPDTRAREILRRDGLEKYFLHSLGHGVGIEVHEKPRLSPNSREILKASMVITVEPALYIKDKVGLRIEELVLVNKEGANILSKNIERIIKV